MENPEQNKLLIEVGRGTPMGEFAADLVNVFEEQPAQAMARKTA